MIQGGKDKECCTEGNSYETLSIKLCFDGYDDFIAKLDDINRRLTVLADTMERVGLACENVDLDTLLSKTEV